MAEPLWLAERPLESQLEVDDESADDACDALVRIDEVPDWVDAYEL